MVIELSNYMLIRSNMAELVNMLSYVICFLHSLSQLSVLDLITTVTESKTLTSHTRDWVGLI